MYSAGGRAPYDRQHVSPSTSHSFSNIPSEPIKVYVNGEEVIFDVSPSTDVSTILSSTIELMFPHLMIQDDGTFFKNLDGTPMAPLGFIDGLTISYESVTITHQRLFVVSDAGSQIIGSELLSALDLIPPLSQQIDDNNQILRLPLNNKEQELKKGMNALIPDGVIVPHQSAWTIPVELVAFANGTKYSDDDNRFTISKEDYLEQLSVNTVIAKLSGNSLFCKLKLDERQYFKKHLDKMSREVCTLVTEDGQYLRPYQQLRYTPKYFHKLLSRKLHGLDVVIVGDYLCVYGKSLVETTYQLSSVSKVLQNMMIDINETQSSYFTESLTVFNVKIDKIDVRELDYNVQPMKPMPRPDSISLIKSLCNKIHYFGPYLNSVFHYLIPLKETCFNDEYPWTPECDLSFEIVREALLFNTTVKHLKDGVKMVLNCTCSFHGIAAVLSAIGEGNMRMPVAFCNAKLDEDQIKYSQIEKDAYAITYALEMFHEFIWGRQFILEINNEHLLDILRAPHEFEEIMSKKLKCWLISFTLYDYHAVPNLTDYNPVEFLAQVV